MLERQLLVHMKHQNFLSRGGTFSYTFFIFLKQKRFGTVSGAQVQEHGKGMKSELSISDSLYGKARKSQKGIIPALV